MKLIKFLSVLALFLTVSLFQSCESDPCEDVTCLNDGICLDGTCDCSTGYSGADCGTHCSADVVGTWNITSGNVGLCDFATYDFAKGSTDTEILVTVTATGGTVITGTGTLSFDCSSMTYTVSTAGGDISGSITFNGNMLTDVISSCTFEATKQ
ncbi:MAG: hypothetical protein AB8H03_01295 [Saprospiraceae bacterium]